MKKWIILFALVLWVAAMLSSCGRGGGGGGFWWPGAKKSQPSYTIGGSVSGLTGSGLVLQNNNGDDLQVAANSTSFTFATALGDGTGYSVSVKTPPIQPFQNCVVSNGTGGVSGANVTTVSVSCTTPNLNLSTFQTASVVIGQPTFTTGSPNQSGSPAANTISYPWGDPVVYNGVLYLPDSVNNRVLGFNSVPTANDASADFVLGEPNFTTVGTGSSDVLMNGPQTARVSDGKLFIDDYGNNRVLIWNSVPTATAAPANIVVGQADLTTTPTVTSCNATTLYDPESLFIVDGKLIVADSDHNRVVIWNTIPASNGAAANIVLGQPNMNTCTAGTVSASSMNYPTDIWSDGVRLIVTDSGNNRVLIWNTFPTTNQAAADIVLGQPDKTSSAAQILSNKSLDFPYFMASNGNQLFVSDVNNNRVMIWNSIPTTDYAPADKVLGQSDFVHNGASMTDRTLHYPTGLFIFDNGLIVGDLQNNRYLIFQGQ